MQVMIQPHNRHMSFSLYICALAVADTIALLNGESIIYIYKIYKDQIKSRALIFFSMPQTVGYKLQIRIHTIPSLKAFLKKIGRVFPKLSI